jgi:hypothetical protein
MIREESSDNVSSDGEHSKGVGPEKTLDKLRAKKTRSTNANTQNLLKKQNLEQARMLREEIDRLNERRVKMADELFEGEKYMAERRADLERSVAEREMRLERLDEKLQETRQKL